LGNDRTFDKIVAASITKESSEMNRERKLTEYFTQPQRGTMRGVARMNEGIPGIQGGGDILIS